LRALRLAQMVAAESQRRDAHAQCFAVVRRLLLNRR
jgi:hypothetical protein